MITKETPVEELIARHPEAVKIFIRHGLPCLVCGEPFWGTVGELASKHDVDLDILLEELNQLEGKTNQI
ncbi:MAG TPA: DUF1858 domain-containing protein [bacterium (Candidatus Stahlbacteria)]|nr:DUF1858 domain-containing protein [Candidatus Stahlbacteria bacterium]